MSGSCSAIPDPYAAFFEWCDANGFQDVGSGAVEDMPPKRFDAAIAAYAARPNDLAQTPPDYGTKNL